MPPDTGRWTDPFLDAMREVGDPVADDPAAAVLAGGQVGQVNQLLRTLVDVDDLVPGALPAELRGYLDATVDLPPWADMDRVARAQRFFQVWGVHISACLFCASLPSSYAAAKGVQVLHLTARLDTDARRRVFETGQFLMDVMVPGGLGDDGKGRRTAQRVRLMHAAVRHLIAARARTTPDLWDPAWGTPINQEDLAATLLAFSYVPAEPLRRLGVEVTDHAAEDYLHTWNVIGHLLGVRDEMLVRDLDDATALVAAVRRRQFAASPAGREMTEALIELLNEMTPTQWADRFIPTLIRHLIGKDVAKLIGVPGGTPAVWRWVPKWVGRAIGRTETYVARQARLQALAEPFGRELLTSIFNHERGGIRAPFDIPHELAESWTINR